MVLYRAGVFQTFIGRNETGFEELPRPEGTAALPVSSETLKEEHRRDSFPRDDMQLLGVLRACPEQWPHLPACTEEACSPDFQAADVVVHEEVPEPWERALDTIPALERCSRNDSQITRMTRCWTSAVTNRMQIRPMLRCHLTSSRL